MKETAYSVSPYMTVARSSRESRTRLPSGVALAHWSERAGHLSFPRASTERSILRWRSLRHRSHREGMKPPTVHASVLRTVQVVHSKQSSNGYTTLTSHNPSILSCFAAATIRPSLSISQTVWQPSVCAMFALRAQDFSSFAVVVIRLQG
ncbi:hypothetical protein BJV77DRAFT_578918 [Russula vinacea]|nr:hypothetical protein BJV77DRAFT_578918 [Russula vinacea]